MICPQKPKQGQIREDPITKKMYIFDNNEWKLFFYVFELDYIHIDRIIKNLVITKKGQ